MNITQRLRRLSQQNSFMKDEFLRQDYQIRILQKLYLKYGLTLHGGGGMPEQYDIKKNGESVAYIRLRHGELSLRCPDHNGKYINCPEPNGDGMFDSDERLKFMVILLRIILKEIE